MESYMSHVKVAYSIDSQDTTLLPMTQKFIYISLDGLLAHRTYYKNTTK